MRSSPPPHPDDEDRYRRHFLPQDSARALFVFCCFLAQGLPLVLADRQLLGDSRTFWILLASRLVPTVACLAGIVAMLRTRSPRTHDAVVATVVVIVVLHTSGTLATRPPDYIGQCTPGVVFINMLYLVIPGPLRVRSASALVFSIATFLAIDRSLVMPLLYNVAVGSYVFSHVIGLTIARWLENVRREGFFAQLAERRAREELARKAADLEAAKLRAESLAHAKSDFLATMSHEFRTPMNAVLGLSDVLATTSLGEDQREMIGIIHRSAESLLVLLNDILDIAKVDAGRITIERAPFDVRECVRGAVDIIAYRAAEKDLPVVVTVAPDVPEGLAGDAARVRQILVNLLSNAVKFTRSGKIEVRVWKREDAGDDRVIAFAVQDSGPGIRPDVLPRLFTPFEQGSGEIARRHGGTGLGLAICKRLVELMGGEIHVESELGRGSTFELWIRAPEAPPPPAAAPRISWESHRVRALSILLVEDNLVNQRVALAMLERLGQEADVASNGREALSALERRDYEVVLMDLRMPEMDGLTAARRIRSERPSGRRPHIIAMTASAFEEDRLACAEAGMEDFVSKPVLAHELGAALRRAAAMLPDSPSRMPTTDIAVLARAPLDDLRKLATPRNPTFFVSICRDFVTDARRCLEKWSASAVSGDAPVAERLAHNLKSMSASVGATRMSALCEELEASAHEGDLAAHPAALEALRAELGRVERALAVEIEKSPQAPDPPAASR